MRIPFYDVLILGAGPAGLISAACHGKEKSVAILEKNSSAGKKLLVTGSGQCNLTHGGDMRLFFQHYHPSTQFVKPCLLAFTNRDLAQFFSSRGLKLTEREDGKVFPVTYRAEDVLNTLLKACNENGVHIFYSHSAQKVEFLEKDSCFQVSTLAGQKNFKWRAKKLIMATGGKSWPRTGSTGDGYILAKMLGHTITEVRPALTPVYIRSYPFGSCAGISLKNRIFTLWRNRQKIMTHVGNLLLTHQGFSGPGILDMSRHFCPGDSLTIHFPEHNEAKTAEDFQRLFLDMLTHNSKKMVKNLISQHFQIQERLTECLLRLCGVPLNLYAWEVDKKTRETILHVLLHYPFFIHHPGDFRESMCTAGGVLLTEVNRKTMESRIRPGLYFCGEILDVDGDTGGYNLQFAFSSGVAAAEVNV
ncbi:MAG: NAD(P)/FAD-dependent oxidoreductase [Planctomycetia bacterium]|nr:NAD(P)/FAD-dependent oxidoreductase [Planctomycetia bacterium]